MKINQENSSNLTNSVDFQKTEICAFSLNFSRGPVICVDNYGNRGGFRQVDSKSESNLEDPSTEINKKKKTSLNLTDK